MADRGQVGFAEAFMAAGAGKNRRLERIAGIVNWTPFERLLKRVRTGETGRPPYPPLSMFKALLLQQWYGLSDPALEEALSDRLSFRQFCGFALEQETPDETTLLRFRHALANDGLAEKLLAELNRQLDGHGLILRQGTMIDATVVSAQAAAPGLNREKAAKSDVDPDADWTRKGGKSFFGYQAHLAVDAGSGLIRKAILAPARVNESSVADDLIIGDERAVYADKAYENKARRAALKARGIKDRIMHRSHKNQARLPHWQAVRNRLIAPIRAGVERTFGLMKRSYGYRRVGYFNLARNGVQLQLMCFAINLRRATILSG